MKQDINKLRDESPVDELFARRLARHSVKPDPAAWERLQTRLAGDSAPRIVVFWQNPAVVRYAAAACVTLLLLAGGWWFLRPLDEILIVHNQRVTQPEKREQLPKTVPTTDRPLPPMTRQTQPMIARNARTLPSSNPAGQAVANAKRAEPKPARSNALPNQQPGEQLAQTEIKPLTISSVTVPKPTEKPITGRVLVVTIAEPDALIEARQAANWSESAEKIIVMADRANPTATDSNLSAQRRRGNRGVGATVASTDDQSLLNLAYRAIKNKVTTNKSLKQ
jgi:hypothetical protein